LLERHLRRRAFACAVTYTDGRSDLWQSAPEFFSHL
jgi:hypothetical protein